MVLDALHLELLESTTCSGRHSGQLVRCVRPTSLLSAHTRGQRRLPLFWLLLVFVVLVGPARTPTWGLTLNPGYYHVSAPADTNLSGMRHHVVVQRQWTGGGAQPRPCSPRQVVPSRVRRLTRHGRPAAGIPLAPLIDRPMRRCRLHTTLSRLRDALQRSPNVQRSLFQCIHQGRTRIHHSRV